MKIQTTVILVAGVTAVSFAAIFIRMSTAPPLIISFYRMFFSVSLLAPLIVFRKAVLSEFKKLTRKDLLLLLASGLFLSIHFAFWVTSLSHTSVASSVVLVTTQPLFIVAVENFVLHKRPSRKLIGGLLVAAVGSILIGYGGFTISGFKLMGDMFALFGAAMAAGYFLIGGQVRKRIELFPYIFVVYGISAMFLLVYCLIAGLPIVAYSPSNYICFLLLAAIPTLIGHTSFNWLLSEVNASLIGITILGEPIGSSILAIIFFEEYPSFWTIIGGSLVLISIYFLWQNELLKGRSEA